MSAQSTRLSRLEANQPPATIPATDTVANAEETNIVRFSREELGVSLYPVQALILKLITASVELLTEFDYSVLNGWCAGFSRVDDEYGARYQGSHGLPPDVVDRMRWCQAHHRWMFREVTLVLGRRASKSFLCAIVVAYQTWRILMIDDPHQRFGMAAGKRLSTMIFSTTRERAESDQFGDVAALIRDAPGFAPFVDRIGKREIRLFTRKQLADGAPSRGRNGLVCLTASPTTSASGRGPAMVTAVFDEAAYADGSGSTSTADDVYHAVRPALAQFRTEGGILLASSPWTMLGRFHEGYLESLAIDPDSGAAAQPDYLTVQLPSDALYQSWEQAHVIEMWPSGPMFDRVARPIFVFDESLERLQRLSPQTFAVEYLGQWATSQQAYFSDSIVRTIFGPVKDTVVEMQTRGQLGYSYVAHGDPGLTGSNFAFVIAHKETIDSHEHVIVDLIRVWEAKHFDDGRIEFDKVQAEIHELIQRFRPNLLTFDSYGSELLINQLSTLVRRDRIDTRIHAVNAGTEKFNRYGKTWSTASAGLLHIPFQRLARDEFRFLQRNGRQISHPSSGLVQTDDIVDSITWAVEHLLGPNEWTRQAFTDLSGGPTDAQALFAHLTSRRPRHTGYLDPGAHPRWSPLRTR